MKRIRASLIIVENGRVALMKRERAGRTYYVFPGGGVEVGETNEEAAIREAFEELGVNIKLGELIEMIEFRESIQLYYLATIHGGVFGTGEGPEFSYPPEDERGSYTPVWIDIRDLSKLDVRPIEIINLLQNMKEEN